MKAALRKLIEPAISGALLGIYVYATGYSAGRSFERSKIAELVDVVPAAPSPEVPAPPAPDVEVPL